MENLQRQKEVIIPLNDELNSNYEKKEKVDVHSAIRSIAIILSFIKYAFYVMFKVLRLLLSIWCWEHT